MPEEKANTAGVVEKNLERAQKILDFMDQESITRTEFVDAFEKVVELVLKIQKQQGEAITRLEETYRNLLNKNDSDHSERFKTLKGQVNDLFVGDQLKRMDGEIKTNFGKLEKFINQAIENKLQEADEKVSQLKPIKGDKGDIGDAGPMPTEHLELMKEVKAELLKVKDVLANRPRGGMGRAKVQIIRAVDLTSQVDGVVTTYTLPMDTVDVLLVWSTQFPVILRPTTDFTFAGRTLTLTSQVGTIQSGQSLTCLADVLFYP